MSTNTSILSKDAFSKWLKSKNHFLTQGSIKILCQLVVNARNLEYERLMLQDRATRLGVSNVSTLLKTCTPNYETCLNCGLHERYFEVCFKCKETFFCSLLCKSKCVRKHRKKCRKLCLKQEAKE